MRRGFLVTVMAVSCALAGAAARPVPASGAGQRTRQATPRPAQPRAQEATTVPAPEVFLSLVLKLSAGGGFKVLKATLVPGKLIAPGVTRADYLYEVTSGGKFLAAGLLADDPFLTRSYGDPRAGGVEGVRAADSATIILHVPNVSAEVVSAGRIGLKLYALRGEAPADKPDAAALRDLKARGLLTPRLELPEKKLGPAIRQKVGGG